MKKVGKTTRPFRYDLNQIPYDYTVEVTKRSNAVDLVGRMSEELWTEIHNIVREVLRKSGKNTQKNYTKKISVTR